MSLIHIKTQKSPPSKGKRSSSPKSGKLYPVRTLMSDIFSGSYENALRVVLNEIMPPEFVFEGRRPHWLVNPYNPAARLEIDFGNDKLGVYIEYNGFQHYTFSVEHHGTLENFNKQVEIDKYKTRKCAEKGILLISINSTIYKTLAQNLHYIYSKVMRSGNDLQKFTFAKYWMKANLKYSRQFSVMLNNGLSYDVDFDQGVKPTLSISLRDAIIVEGLATKKEYGIVNGKEEQIAMSVCDVSIYFYINPGNLAAYEEHQYWSPDNCVLINENDIKLVDATVTAIEKRLIREGFLLPKNKPQRGDR
nr:hypothetical protein K-LCC10_0378 [Kaumoebavirus]